MRYAHTYISHRTLSRSFSAPRKFKDKIHLSHTTPFMIRIYALLSSLICSSPQLFSPAILSNLEFPEDLMLFLAFMPLHVIFSLFGTLVFFSQYMEHLTCLKTFTSAVISTRKPFLCCHSSSLGTPLRTLLSSTLGYLCPLLYHAVL